MKHNSSKVLSTLLILTALSGFGCGQALTGSGQLSSGNEATGTNPNTAVDLSSVSVNKVEAASVDAEAALAEAEAAVSGILNGDQISVPQSDGSVATASVMSKSLTGIDRKVKEALDRVLAKLGAPVQRAKDLIAQARAQIIASLGMLDPNNPAHQDALRRLQELTSRLDQLESRLSGVYKMLASKVDLLIGRLDAVIARLTAGNPLLIIAAFELQAVRDVLVDFRNKLAAL